jgi:hypothetical protein
VRNLGYGVFRFVFNIYLRRYSGNLSVNSWQTHKLSLHSERIPYVIHAVNPVNVCSGIKSRLLNSHLSHKDAIHIYKIITLVVGMNQRNRAYVALGGVVYICYRSGLPIAYKGIALAFSPDGCFAAVTGKYLEIIGQYHQPGLNAFN